MMIKHEYLGQKVYILPSLESYLPTMKGAYRATLLALYQITLVIGILMMPIALATQRVGVHLPIDRAVLRLKEAYEDAE